MANWSLINFTGAASADGNTVTTSPGIDATGATFIAVVKGGNTSAFQSTLSDSEGNVYTLAKRSDNSVRGDLYICIDPLISNAMTWTATGSFSVPSLAVMVFSCSATATDPVDQSAISSTSADTSLSVGPITPAENDELILSFIVTNHSGSPSFSVNSGVTLQVTVNGSANNYAIGFGYKIQTTLAAITPLWSWTGTQFGVAAVESFKKYTPTPSCTGSSPNWTALTWLGIQHCHQLASNGDTITVPAGSYTAGTLDYLSFTKHIILTCAGNRTCTITDNTTTGEDSTPMFTIRESTAGSTTVKDFRFVEGSGVHTGATAMIAMIITASGKPIIIQNNEFDMSVSANGNTLYATTNRGLVTGNDATGTYAGGSGQCTGNVSFLRHLVPSQPWSTVAKWGALDTNGDQALYVENNTMHNMAEMIDTSFSGRCVVRFNTITNCAHTSHGEADPSARYVEYYMNTFARDETLIPTCNGGIGGGLAASGNGWGEIRAGTAIVHSNVIPDCCGPTWGDKGEWYATLQTLRRNHGPFGCWSTINYPAAGYPAPYQPGWGYTAGGTNPGGSGVLQDLEPIYYVHNSSYVGVFSNSGGEMNFDECGPSPPSSSDYLQADREWYTDGGEVSGGTTSLTTGTLWGTKTQMNAITTCTQGVGFWVTDEGSWNTENGTVGASGYQKGQGQLYKCGSSNNWQLYYTPYIYPHPLSTVEEEPVPPPNVRPVLMIS